MNRYVCGPPDVLDHAYEFALYTWVSTQGIGGKSEIKELAAEMRELTQNQGSRLRLNHKLNRKRRRCLDDGGEDIEAEMGSQHVDEDCF